MKNIIMSKQKSKTSNSLKIIFFRKWLFGNGDNMSAFRRKAWRKKRREKEEGRKMVV